MRTAMSVGLQNRGIPRVSRNMHFNLGASSALSTSSALAMPSASHFFLQRRFETTGEYHEYKPGPVARALRAVVVVCTPTTAKKWLAGRMTAGMERVEKMEKEQQWIKTHGSPLKVMGLPEHAELEEVKSRYTDLLFMTHPDTAVAKTFGRRDAATDRLEKDRLENISSPTKKEESTKEEEPQQPDQDQQRQVQLARIEEERAVAAAEKLRAEEYILLKEAYALITTPDSVWHLNGSAPHILDVIQPPQTMLAQVATPVRVAFTASQIVGASAAGFFLFFVVPFCLHKWLEFIDPELVEFTESVKAEDAERIERGENIDISDKARYASPAMQRILTPGKVIASVQNRHIEEDEQDADDVFQALRLRVAGDFGSGNKSGKNTA